MDREGMDLQEWRRLAAWIGTLWPAPGYEAAQVEAAYFIVRDFEAEDVRAALTEHALIQAVPATPHPSELRQITQRWVRSKRRRPGPAASGGDESPAPPVALADDELVHTLVRDLRRGLGRRSTDPLRVGDGSAVEAGRSRVRSIRSLTAALPRDTD